MLLGLSFFLSFFFFSFFFLSFFLSISSTYLLYCISLPLCLSVCLPITVSHSLSVCLPNSVSHSLSVCLSMYCIFLCLSLSVYLSMYLYHNCVWCLETLTGRKQDLNLAQSCSQLKSGNPGPTRTKAARDRINGKGCCTLLMCCIIYLLTKSKQGRKKTSI